MRFLTNVLRFALPAVFVASTNLVLAHDCPFLKSSQNSGLQPHLHHHRRRLNPNERVGDGGVPEGGYKAVRDELRKVLLDSKAFFPADFDPPNYGGLMIRLAWHCAGSFRESDGRGGCDGGRIRFAPELDWEDNANLDQALKILEPVKEKFGPSLSWGDLIILAGNTAIESMGGPILGFCGGRVDDSSGGNSLILGPNAKQELLSPCVSIGRQGRCLSPLGPTTVGLIYVNPAGPVDENGAHGDPAASGEDIRNAFGRMGFSDRESVALIGGGHAFGKCHGACDSPPCGTGDLQGIGNNTFTSGFEGSWTTRPTTWSNDYFNHLFDFEYELVTGPGGNPQWQPSDGFPIMMLTSDRALTEDPTYRPIAREYADNITALEKDFMLAWYRLTTADMGPPDRCLGDEVPEPQSWQHVLPTFDGEKPDYAPIRDAIEEKIEADGSSIASFAKLALNCASTFRETDYRGGCNGARIRFFPEIEWPINAGAEATLAELEKVKEKYPNISFADLIVLAGNVAIEAAGGNSMEFCGGRVDASSGDGSDNLEPRFYPDTPALSVEDDMTVKGLSLREGVALYAIPQGLTLSNEYFVKLKAGEGDFSVYELALLETPFVTVVEEYIADNDAFLEEFSNAWTKMMTADRYDGPTGNVCAGVNDFPSQSTPTKAPTASGAPTVGVLGSFLATILGTIAVFIYA